MSTSSVDKIVHYLRKYWKQQAAMCNICAAPEIRILQDNCGFNAMKTLMLSYVTFFIRTVEIWFSKSRANPKSRAIYASWAARGLCPLDNNYCLTNTVLSHSFRCVQCILVLVGLLGFHVCALQAQITMPLKWQFSNVLGKFLGSTLEFFRVTTGLCCSTVQCWRSC